MFALTGGTLQTIQLQQLMEALTDEEFNDHRTALIAHIEEKDKTLGKEAIRYWTEIATHKYLFNRRELLVKQLREVTKDAVLKFFDERIAKGAPHRSKLSVHIYGNKFPLPAYDANDEERKKKDAQDNIQRIDKEASPAKFKRALSLFPENT